jgi:hypothetical protein
MCFIEYSLFSQSNSSPAGAGQKLVSASEACGIPEVWRQTVHFGKDFIVENRDGDQISCDIQPEPGRFSAV